jgi:hypothetical protein
MSGSRRTTANPVHLRELGDEALAPIEPEAAWRGGDRRRSLTLDTARVPARRHDDGLRSAPEWSLPPAPAGLDGL